MFFRIQCCKIDGEIDMNKRKHKIRLLVTDMDGTFLNSSSEIPQKNIDTVAHLKEHGVPTVICTGRPVSFVRQFIHQSGASSTVISCNGAVIADAFSNDVLYSQNLPVDTVKHIVNFLLTKNIDCLAYSEAGVILFSEGSERINTFRAYNEKLSDNIAAAKNAVTIITKKTNDEDGFCEIAKFILS